MKKSNFARSASRPRKSETISHMIKLDLLLLLCCFSLTALNRISLPAGQFSFTAKHTGTMIENNSSRSSFEGRSADFPTDQTDDTATAYAAASKDIGTAATSAIIGTEDSDWALILVNKWNPLPKDYEVELTRLTNGQTVDSRIYPALQAMFDAARAEGIYPVVASGYRTAEKQQSLLEDKILWYESQGCTPEEARTNAEAWVAVPGTSEHQLGIAVDINADGIRSKGDAVYDWLDNNGYQFGFIRRYPADKTDITGIINEPWHYRYVGLEAAKQMHSQNLCLEEYLDSVSLP